MRKGVLNLYLSAHTALHVQKKRRGHPGKEKNLNMGRRTLVLLAGQGSADHHSLPNQEAARLKRVTEFNQRGRGEANMANADNEHTQRVDHLSSTGKIGNGRWVGRGAERKGFRSGRCNSIS